MLTIRLQRIGKKHQPSYRLVVAEKRSKLGGPAKEDLGFYNPLRKDAGFKAERILYWLGVGAKPSAMVHNLLVRHNILKGPKIKISIKKKSSSEAAPKPAETAAESSVEMTTEMSADASTA